MATACDIDIDKEAVKTAAFPEALEEINLLQAKLYAQSTYGLIIVLQAMDAAGKDGTIKHVFSHLDPNGVHVVSFKQPNSEEKDHDYMWRINRALPRRGDIGIFNRSHYEDVIVTRVHDLIKDDKLPQNLVNKNIWDTRYRQIKDWDRYQELYSEMITATSTKDAPWYIVPADNKWYTRFVVSQIVIKALRDIAPEFPEMSKEIKNQLDEFRRLIESGNVGMIEEMQDMMKGGN